MIETKPGRYFSHQWFVPGPSVDFLVALYRDKSDAPDMWHITGRFRYYSADSQNPHDGKDMKAWYEGEFCGTEEDAVERMDTIVAVVALRFGEQPFKTKLASDDPETIMGILMKLPYTHVTPTGQGGDA